LRIFSDWLSHAPETRERLEQEVATLQLITHPALVPIACAEFHEGGRPSFLATPFIPGASLMRRLAAQGTFTAPDALRLLEPVLDVVAVLHGHGIVHENIRPSNIVIDTTGQAHLTDSDLSRVVNVPGPPLPGSYEYMSPERLTNQPTSPASDIYSIGCLLYEMLTGVPPFTGTAEQVRIQQQDDRPAPVLVKNPDVPGGIAVVVMRCLERDPLNRYESGDALEAALGLAKPSQTAMFRTGQVKRPLPIAITHEASKRPLWTTFATVAAGLAFAGWAGYTFAPSKAEQHRSQELQRFHRLDWSRVTSEAMPRECFGYQPCADRRQALTRDDKR
jgi:serine/threonine protein kinase